MVREVEDVGEINQNELSFGLKKLELYYYYYIYIYTLTTKRKELQV